MIVKTAIGWAPEFEVPSASRNVRRSSRQANWVLDGQLRTVQPAMIVIFGRALNGGTVRSNARKRTGARRPVSLGFAQHRKRPRAGNGHRPRCRGCGRRCRCGRFARRRAATRPGRCAPPRRPFLCCPARRLRALYRPLTRSPLRFRHPCLLSAPAPNARARAPCWRGPGRALPDRGRCPLPTSRCSIPDRTRRG